MGYRRWLSGVPRKQLRMKSIGDVSARVYESFRAMPSKWHYTRFKKNHGKQMFAKHGLHDSKIQAKLIGRIFAHLCQSWMWRKQAILVAMTIVARCESVRTLS